MSKIYVIGLGPGGAEDLTPRALAAIQAADVIVGYKTYVDLVRVFYPEGNFRPSAMMQEVDRCRECLALASGGQTVALVSSGDSGIYGMAGIMLEVAAEAGSDIPVEVVPGMTAASSAASVLGAPLMHDTALISLSDLLTPWDVILRRLKSAAEGDFVVCLYNPRSKKRVTQLTEAAQMLMSCRAPETPVGIVTHSGRPEQHVQLTTLAGLDRAEVDMFSIVIVGNSHTVVRNGKMVTPRGYQNRYQLG